MVWLHKSFWVLLRWVSIVFLRLKFGYTYQVARDLPEQYMVLANHTTDFDPFFVGASFPKQMYYVASEHISRWGFLSKIIGTFLNPILRNKGSNAAATVKDVLKRTREGHNICIFAEGNRSWDGLTGQILPSTGKLVQKAGVALVTYKITGGYFVSPRWSSKTRRGPVHGEVAHIYTKEQLAAMTADQINQIICADLFEDAYARQKAAPRAYQGKNLAEKLELLLYLCPQCGGQETFRSQGDHVRCTCCGLGLTYDRYGMLQGAPYQDLTAFHRWQQEQTALAAQRGETFTSASGTLTTVQNSQSVQVDQGPVSLSPQALTCGQTAIPLESISYMDLHGKQGLVLSAGREYYELKPEGNALKFVLLFRQYHEAAKNKA